jgi:hypothetical protein
VARDANPAKSVARYLEAYPADFIILASHSHEGRASWLRRPVAATHRPPTEQMTLFLPNHVPDFVSAQDDSVSLNRILILIAAKPRPQLSLEAATIPPRPSGSR